MARRKIDRAKAELEIVDGRRVVLTLRAACEATGVHVATACRWQAQDPDFAQELRDAVRDYRIEVYLATPLTPRSVAWRRDCPLCRAKVVIRKALGRIPFWRCGRWPLCSWASWRPRHPRDCRRCGGPRFWSHSRKSVGCDRCRNANCVSLSGGTNPPQTAPKGDEMA
jgi:hypothetical protein